MNIYSVIALAFFVVFVTFFLNLGPAIEQFANKPVDIPSFQDKGSNPALFDLAVRLAYLIAIVGIFRILFSRRNDNE